MRICKNPKCSRENRHPDVFDEYCGPACERKHEKFLKWSFGDKAKYIQSPVRQSHESYDPKKTEYKISHDDKAPKIETKLKRSMFGLTSKIAAYSLTQKTDAEWKLLINEIDIFCKLLGDKDANEAKHHFKEYLEKFQEMHVLNGEGYISDDMIEYFSPGFRPNEGIMNLEESYFKKENCI
jgi:hypothetical protein